ncbi:hypothetical protein GGR54DRAFT_179017 [Hypoxylon sp. NC1633]|nr:hypothetical protein GGR54DRAFT_179017 [Hypoxylon sp. NC1633]
MAEVFCACIISNLEGMHTGGLPIEGELSSTLEALDKRTRRLETSSRITPPPPMLETSWDSLTWRVCRLARRSSGNTLRRSPPLQSVASLPLLRSVIASLNGQSRFDWPEKEDLEEAEVLRKAGQWLCRYAGQRGFQIKNPTFELGPVCSLAMDLSLESEAGFPWRPMGPMGPMPHPPPPPFMRKACCGCCSCSCHKDSSEDSIRSGRRCNAFFGWFKKLAFWRKKRVADDASSTSGTIVSD